MASSNEILSPLAWELKSIPEELRELKVLRVTDTLRRSINSLKPEPEHKEPAVRSLYNALPPLAPEIIHFFPGSFSNQPTHPYWLAAEIRQQIDLKYLLQGMQAWANACYGGKSTQAANAANWSIDDFKWDTLDLATANQGIQKRVLPAMLARYLCRQQEYEFILRDTNGNRTRSERMIISVNPRAVNKAELISWPPRKVTNNRGWASYYSYFQSFWLDIMPGTNSLYMYSHSGVRRWQSRSLLDGDFAKIKQGRGKNVYLLRENSWMTQSESQPFLVPITLARYGSDFYFVGHQPRVLNALSMTSIPDANVFAQNVEKSFPEMALVYDDMIKDAHEIGKGIEMNDHRDTLGTLNEVLPKALVPMSNWENIQGGRKYRRASKSYAEIGGKTALEEKPDTEPQIPDEVRTKALSAIPKSIRIELHVEDMRPVKEQILKAFGLLKSNPDALDQDHVEISFGSDGQKLILTPFKETDLMEGLPPYASDSDEANLDAMNRRINEIKTKLPKPKERTGVLVEMPWKSYTGKLAFTRRDPKQAVARGLALSGRVKQNIVPMNESKNYSHRLQNALSDLLRQLDFRLEPLYDASFKNTALPSVIDLIAFYRIQLNATSKGEKTVQIPVISLVRSGEYSTNICVPTDKGSSRWYNNTTDGLLAAATLENGFDEQNCIAFYKEAIMALNISRDALLILSDQNMRKLFPELEDSQNHDTRITLTGILSAQPKVRLARLRMSSQNEAAHMVPNDRRSKYQGLYKNDHYPNVFCSLHSLPNLQPNSEWTQVDREEEQSRNISNVQIALYNLANGDIAEEWAWLVHQLRRQSSHTDIPTLLPEPLHSAKLISEYVFRANLEDDYGDEVSNGYD